MVLYIEHLTLINFITKVLPFILSLKQSDERLKSCYYIDATRTGEKITKWTGIFLRVKVTRLEFELRHIKDERGELVRLRIPREDLFRIQRDILNSNIYQQLFRKEWDKGRLSAFLAKGVIPIDRNHPHSAFKTVYIIQVIAWHMKQKRIAQCKLFLKKRCWMEVYSVYSSKLGITLNSTFWLPDFKKRFINFLYKFPSLIYFLKKLRSLDFSTDVSSPPDTNVPKIAFFGRGDFNLENNGLHSDVFFWLQSELPAENIIYSVNRSFSEQDIQSLEKTEMHVARDFYMNRRTNHVSEKQSWFAPIPQKLTFYSNEAKFIRDQVLLYNNIKRIWSRFCEIYGIKVYLTWYKYDNIHMAIADALEEQGGISAVWQMAYDGIPFVESNTFTDVAFGFSTWAIQNEKIQGSNIPYYIAIGYPKDYCVPLLKKQAREMRACLQRKGARKIVAIFDENSGDDDRWHTGHPWQRENYQYILEKVLDTPWLGVIFKPKVAKTLRKRLGPVSDLLVEAEATGRCYVYEISGQNTTIIPPVLAGLASDIAIHGHLSAGTGAVECALAGIKTLLIDREGLPDSRLYQLGEGKVVFKDWPELIEALFLHWESEKGIPCFGDWTPLLNELDPFRDGKAAYRMGTYLHWLIQGFENGQHRDTILADAAERYCKQWGYDKIASVP